MAEEEPQPADDSQAPIRRSVRVIDASTGAPIASASIEWAYGVWNWGKGERASAKTGADGTAALVFENPCSVARVTAAGFAPQEFAHVIPEVIRLTKAREISGVVLDDVSGLPIDGASVDVFDPDVPSDADFAANYIRDDLGASGTDVAGRFCAEAGDAGPVRVECTAAGYEPTMVGVDDPGSSTVTLRLRPSGVIRGVVRDPFGHPAQAVEVLCDGEGTTCRTDEDGQFEFAGVRLGVAHVVETSAFSAGESRFSPARPITGIVLTAEKRLVECELSLRDATDVVVLVRDDAGAPVPKAAIATTPQSVRSEGTDESGRGRLDLVEPGRLQVHATADGFRPAETEIDVQEGCTATVELQLVRGAEISGRIVDDRGTPLQAAEVRLWAGKSCEQLVASDADGRFVLRTIRDGAVVVTAASRGHVDVRTEIRSAPCTGLRLVATRCAEITATVPAAHVGCRYDFDFHWIAQSGAVTRGSCFPEESEGWRIQEFIPPGKGRLRLFLPDSVPLEVPLVVEPGATRELGSLRPDPGATADLLVRDAQGIPVGAASVEVRQDGEVRGRAETGADGHCRFRGLSRGDASVRVEAQTFALRAVRIDVGGTDETHRVTIQAGVPVVVQLEVEPCGPVVVSLRQDGATPSDLLATEETYADRSVQWWVTPGRYVVRCGDIEKTIDVISGGRTGPVPFVVPSEPR